MNSSVASTLVNATPRDGKRPAWQPVTSASHRHRPARSHWCGSVHRPAGRRRPGRSNPGHVSTCSSPSTAHTTLATIGTGGDSVCSGTVAARPLVIGWASHGLLGCQRRSTQPSSVGGLTGPRRAGTSTADSQEVPRIWRCAARSMVVAGGTGRTPADGRSPPAPMVQPCGWTPQNSGGVRESRAAGKRRPSSLYTHVTARCPSRSEPWSVAQDDPRRRAIDVVRYSPRSGG
jgi:hypothetical protein